MWEKNTILANIHNLSYSVTCIQKVQITGVCCEFIDLPLSFNRLQLRIIFHGNSIGIGLFHCLIYALVYQLFQPRIFLTNLCTTTDNNQNQQFNFVTKDYIQNNNPYSTFTKNKLYHCTKLCAFFFSSYTPPFLCKIK